MVLFSPYNQRREELLAVVHDLQPHILIKCQLHFSSVASTKYISSIINYNLFLGI